jgi:hypothetical protein
MVLVMSISAFGIVSKGDSMTSKNPGESVKVEQIDGSDLGVTEEWARGICRGVKVSAAAEALNVEPSLPAVIEALTGSLPPLAQSRAAAICREELVT